MSMSSAAAQFLAGARVVLAAALVAAVIPRAQLLVALVVLAALEALLPDLADLEAAAVALTVASADEAEAVEALLVIEEVSVVVVSAAEVAAAAAAAVTVADAEASDINPTAMDLPMALQLVPAVHGAADLAGTDQAEAIVAADDTTTDEAVAVTIEDPAALTMNRSAAEIDTATAMVDMVEAEMGVETEAETEVETEVVMEAETKAHGSAHTTATAMTIHGHDDDIKPGRWLSLLVQGFVKGYLPFLRPSPFPSMRVRSTLFSS